jgi:hypothetical protein
VLVGAAGLARRVVAACACARVAAAAAPGNGRQRHAPSWHMMSHCHRTSSMTGHPCRHTHTHARAHACVPHQRRRCRQGRPRSWARQSPAHSRRRPARSWHQAWRCPRCFGGRPGTRGGCCWGCHRHSTCPGDGLLIGGRAAGTHTHTQPCMSLSKVVKQATVGQGDVCISVRHTHQVACKACTHAHAKKQAWARAPCVRLTAGQMSHVWPLWV